MGSGLEKNSFGSTTLFFVNIFINLSEDIPSENSRKLSLKIYSWPPLIEEGNFYTRTLRAHAGKEN
jgi:hypothetical protein